MKTTVFKRMGMFQRGICTFGGALNFQLEDLFQSIFKNFECYINLVFPLAKTVLIDNRFTQTTVWNQMNLPIFISHSNDRNV